MKKLSTFKELLTQTKEDGRVNVYMSADPAEILERSDLQENKYLKSQCLRALLFV